MRSTWQRRGLLPRHYDIPAYRMRAGSRSLSDPFVPGYRSRLVSSISSVSCVTSLNRCPASSAAPSSVLFLSARDSSIGLALQLQCHHPHLPKPRNFARSSSSTTSGPGPIWNHSVSQLIRHPLKPRTYYGRLIFSIKGNVPYVRHAPLCSSAATLRLSRRDQSVPFHAFQRHA